jgi:hypothetical protein
MSKRARKSDRSKLRFEALEGRLLLAAAPLNNVNIRVDGTTLMITGDNYANQIALTQSGGVFQVEALDGTHLNGNPIAGGVYNVPNGRKGIKDVKIDLKGGDDQLTIGTHDTTPTTWPAFTTQIWGNLEINMGAGNDSLGIASTQVVGNAKINTGAGVDVVGIVFCEFGKNLEVTMGNQGEALGIAGSSVRKEATLKTGSGADGVFLFGLSCDTLKVDTGAGDDLFAAPLIDTEIPPGTLTADEIAVIVNHPGIASVKAREAVFEAGAGADEFFLSDLNISRELVVKMGAGNDTLTIDNNGPTTGNAYGKAELDGGSGINTLSILGTNLLPHGKTKVEHFVL